MHTGTHTYTGLTSTSARPPQSVRLLLNPKVTGGYENVPTVYPGAFLKIILRLFTTWPRHGDQLWAGLLRACSPGRGLALYFWNIVTCGLSSCHELPSAREAGNGLVLWFRVQYSDIWMNSWLSSVLLQRLIFSLFLRDTKTCRPRNDFFMRQKWPFYVFS